MMKPNNKNFFTRFLMIGASLFVAGFFNAAPADAHTDPGGCTNNGVGLSFAVFRADGTTPVGGGTVQSGETIKYEATLSHLGAPNCNFESGTLTITTPDGAPHVFGGVIPLITFGVPFTAPQQSYVVSEADVVGANLHALVSYSGGISHTGDVHDSAAASVDKNTPYETVALEVTKTAVPASGVTYQWTIDKTAMPAAWHLFNGDSGTSQYTIVLTKSVASSAHSVSGTITIHNPAQFVSATITSVTDAITGVGAAAVVCPGGLPQALSPGADLVCTYAAALPDNAMRTNTATVATSGDVGGGSDDAAIDFTNVVPAETNGTVHVDDTNNAGDGGPFSDSTQYSYERTFTCGADEGTHNNTATIVETDQSDSAAVTVHCHALTVNKTAETSFEGEFEWDITKEADATDITLASGEAYDIHYTVTAEVVGSTEGSWMVEGIITVQNPAPIPATLNSVTDVVSGMGAAAVDCGATVFPFTLGPGADLICSYSKALSDGDNRTNTATAVQQNYDYNAQMVPTPDGTTDVSGNAAITFGAADTVIDEMVTVTDSYAGVLGTATVAESPKSFHYTRTVSFPAEECGSHDIDNTATLTTNDTSTMMSDDQTVHVMVNCPGTCTYTENWWMDNLSEWPVNSLQVGNWVYSKTQLYFILRMSDGHNGLMKVAQPLIGVKLNLAKGADGTDVAAAVAEADTLIGNAKLPFGGFGYPETDQVMHLVKALEKYNQGITGPGNCGECLCIRPDGSEVKCEPKP